ncbi:NtaA/DmoA family FMN-dependent monooxygenase [Frigoribacterium sp. 2-23]|uniref:NtaA/DmoA family FMN-dependent monooxygenase n=1 Tax=Frigoribacterium sp. 2-23 TaxID=3415006 RepID=UPI003C6EC872
MSEPKKLILNLFEMNCVGHITHGLWRLPGNHRREYTDIDYWTTLARLAEKGGFDAIFIADVLGAYDVYQGSPAPALREGLQIPNNDPMLVVPAMAAVTEHVGFGITFSTSYEPPFAFARRMSTLDHLTKGRVGWNVVTSYLPNAARNFGLDAEIPKSVRYEIADEFLEVVYKLWEGSWEDDAVLADPTGAGGAGVYTDPAKVHPIDHVGTHFKVAGPHLSEPSLQRTPVLYLATASKDGIERAGRHAEVVFTGGGALGPTAEATRAVAVDAGRDASDVRFVVQAGVITAPTEEEVAAKLALYRSFASEQGKLIHRSIPIDAFEHPRSRTVGEALEAEGKSGDPAAASLPLGLTVGELIDAVDEAWGGRFFVAGTPENVADEIERWLDDEGVDGINLRQYHSFDTLTDFVDLVVPELRRRGRLRDAYRDGETLRERVTSGGARLPESHPAASYRR